MLKDATSQAMTADLLFAACYQYLPCRRTLATKPSKIRTNFEALNGGPKMGPKMVPEFDPRNGAHKMAPKEGVQVKKSNHNSNLKQVFGRHFLDPILAIKNQILAPFWGPFFGPHFGVSKLVQIFNSFAKDRLRGKYYVNL